MWARSGQRFASRTTGCLLHVCQQNWIVREMQDKIVVGPDCSRIFDSERKAAEDAAKEAQQTITPTPKFDISASVEVAIRQRLPTIALTPPSKDRWDIDVFWCARSDPDAQSANFTRVLHQGLALGALAQRGDRMGNERLGQIRGGSVCLHKDWQRISGSSAGCFLDLPIWGVMQGGRSPTGMTTHIGGQIHAATFTGMLSKYD